MNNKCRRTLAKIFEEPPPTDLTWTNIEDLLMELAKDYNGYCSAGSQSGARTFVRINGVTGYFEYPQMANAGTIEDVRDFLVNARIIQ